MQNVQLVNIRNLLYCDVTVTNLDRLSDAVFNYCLHHNASIL